jgi:diguanylate cyclase (GGDEF)-like protein
MHEVNGLPRPVELDWYLGYLYCDLVTHGNCPPWREVLITERLEYGANGLPLRAERVFTVGEYRDRFRDLCARRWPWINLSAVGLWNRRLLLDVTVPDSEPGGCQWTSVNLSGPLVAVREREYDVTRLVELLMGTDLMSPGTDPLTGLPNRHAFFEHLAAASGDCDFSVLFIDIDGLRFVTGALGGNVSDRVITDTARILVASTGESSFVARVGGDEFSMLVERASADRIATECLERIRSSFQVERQETRANAGPAGIIDPPDQAFLTLSIGILHLATCETTPDLTLAAAEQACQRAKARGGDCIFSG